MVEICGDEIICGRSVVDKLHGGEQCGVRVLMMVFHFSVSKSVCVVNKRGKIINIINIEVSQMFKNTYQSGFLSILYSIGSKPLQIWDKQSIFRAI